VAQHPTVAVLTDGRWTPREIARDLLGHGIEDREVIICENLSYPEERITVSDVRGALASADSRGLSVVIIRKRKGCPESSQASSTE
jgi:precorrin-6B methylase 1